MTLKDIWPPRSRTEHGHKSTKKTRFSHEHAREVGVKSTFLTPRSLRAPRQDQESIPPILCGLCACQAVALCEGWWPIRPNAFLQEHAKEAEESPFRLTQSPPRMSSLCDRSALSVRHVSDFPTTRTPRARRRPIELESTQTIATFASVAPIA